MVAFCAGLLLALFMANGGLRSPLVEELPLPLGCDWCLEDLREKRPILAEYAGRRRPAAARVYQWHKGRATAAAGQGWIMFAERAVT